MFYIHGDAGRLPVGARLRASVGAFITFAGRRLFEGLIRENSQVSISRAGKGGRAENTLSL